MMRRLRWLLVVLASLAFGVTSVAPASAQPAIKADKGGRRIDKLRQRLLRDRMGLDEAKAGQVETILRDHIKQRRAAQGKMRSAQLKLRDLLRADSSDQAAYGKALGEVEKAHNDVERLRKKHFTELRALLSPKQQAQLIHAMHKIKRHLSRKRGERRRRGPKGPRGPKRRGPKGPRGPR
jgi:Spy/CpxP family protein refolding chaperone